MKKRRSAVVNADQILGGKTSDQQYSSPTSRAKNNALLDVSPPLRLR